MAVQKCKQTQLFGKEVERFTSSGIPETLEQKEKRQVEKRQ